MGRARPAVGPRRGDLHLVRLDPTVGSEIKKTRPALILQNDRSNTHGSMTIVAPLTTKFDEGRLYPTEALIRAPEGGLRHDSVVQLNQVRAVDKRRLVKCLGTLGPETMHRIERAFLITFDLRDLAILHGFLKESGLSVSDLLKGL